MSRDVALTPEALDQLDVIEQYIADNGSPLAAARYVDAIVSFCESLATFPLRGTPRDDLLPGLRTTHYRGNAVIAYTTSDSAPRITVVGVFYCGQNWQAKLTDMDMP